MDSSHGAFGFVDGETQPLDVGRDPELQGDFGVSMSQKGSPHPTNCFGPFDTNRLCMFFHFFVDTRTYVAPS